MDRIGLDRFLLKIQPKVVGLHFTEYLSIWAYHRPKAQPSRFLNLGKLLYWAYILYQTDPGASGNPILCQLQQIHILKIKIIIIDAIEGKLEKIKSSKEVNGTGTGTGVSSDSNVLLVWNSLSLPNGAIGRRNYLVFSSVWETLMGDWSWSLFVFCLSRFF